MFDVNKGQTIRFVVILIVGIFGLLLTAHYFDLGGELVDSFFEADFGLLPTESPDIEPPDIQYSIDVNSTIVNTPYTPNFNFSMKIDNEVSKSLDTDYTIRNADDEQVGSGSVYIDPDDEEEVLAYVEHNLNNLVFSDGLDNPPYHPNLYYEIDIEIEDSDGENVEETHDIHIDFCDSGCKSPPSLEPDPNVGSCPFGDPNLPIDDHDEIPPLINHYNYVLCENEAEVSINDFEITPIEQCDVAEYENQFCVNKPDGAPHDKFYAGPLNISKEGYYYTYVDLTFKLFDPDGNMVICTENIDGCDFNNDDIWDVPTALTNYILDKTQDSTDVNNLGDLGELYREIDEKRGYREPDLNPFIFIDYQDPNEYTNMYIPNHAENGTYEYEVNLYKSLQHDEKWDSVSGEIELIDAEEVDFDMISIDDLNITPVSRCDAAEEGQFCRGDEFKLGPANISSLVEDEINIFEDPVFSVQHEDGDIVIGTTDTPELWYSDATEVEVDEKLIEYMNCTHLGSSLGLSPIPLPGHETTECHFGFESDIGHEYEVRIPDGTYVDPADTGEYEFEIRFQDEAGNDYSSSEKFEIIEE